MDRSDAKDQLFRSDPIRPLYYPRGGDHDAPVSEGLWLVLITSPRFVLYQRKVYVVLVDISQVDDVEGNCDFFSFPGLF